MVLLRGFLVLVVFFLLGEALRVLVGLPISGGVLGMVMVTATLMLRGRVSDQLAEASRGLISVLVLLIAAVTLPDRVPIHFGPGGEADRIVGRQEALVTFAVVGLGIAVLMVGLARWMRRAPLTMVNVPHKDWWTATPARESGQGSR